MKKLFNKMTPKRAAKVFFIAMVSSAITMNLLR